MVPSRHGLGDLVLVFAAILSTTCASGSAQSQLPGVLEDRFEPIRFGDAGALAWDEPFFPPTPYDASVATPDSVLGQPLGSRLSHHGEIVECFRRWAGSGRIGLFPYGRTHEGRSLFCAVLTSPRNHGRFESIRADLARLSDPRDLPEEEAQSILERVPAVAWLGYSIHGDELSGCDAALAVAYHLLAGQSAEVEEMLEQVVTVIDPCLNPDGRERIVSMVEQMTGRTPNLDYESMQRGRWPYGRGNHYLFDLNRDWMAGTQPETRGRWRAALAFRPQLFVDAHEMGHEDTYLFYPQAKPHNPFLPKALSRWQLVFGGDQARAFDGYGWSYYTREWADAWAPFYSDAWASLNGAVGILYEQAATGGAALRRPSGRILTYREAVHHHVVSSWANLVTLKENRLEILRDYLAHRRESVAPDAPGNDRMWILLPGKHLDREEKLLDLLHGQGIEIFEVREPFAADDVVDGFGKAHETFEVPAGSFLVRARQPQGALTKSYLQFDVRVDKETLVEEREELEARGRTKMYDVTAWSLPLAFDVNSLWCDDEAVEAVAWKEREELEGRVVPAPDLASPVVAWIVDGSLDRSVSFAAKAMELGVRGHLADEPFRTAGRSFPRGSLVVRRSENEADVEEKVARAAQHSGVEVFSTSSARGEGEGHDLGGQHFLLLERPRVALLGNAPVSTDAYGHVWHHLDRDVGVSVSLIDAQGLGDVDLRRFNVFVIPSAGGSLKEALSSLKEGLKGWITAGGTLIACGSAAEAVANKELGLTSVVLLQDALDDVEGYRFEARRELAAREIVVDEKTVWGEGKKEGEPAEPPRQEEEKKEAPEAEAKKVPDPEREDEWKRKFSPSGVFLRGYVDPHTWITAGSGEEAPVYHLGSAVFLAREPVVTAVRFAREENLRLSGLLWPEARERIAESAAVTVERVGKGQVILFATSPAFRGTLLSSARLFANAVVYGPGAGASPPRY